MVTGKLGCVLAVLIDFEGIDGSGKGTQARLLQDRLNHQGVRTALVGFPRYQETQFGRAVADFLNGRFGALHEVDPLLVSLLYAGDRFESRTWLLDQMATHDVVILDRYVPSNLAHQGSKVSADRRPELIQWIEHLEYDIYQLPRPDIVLLMDLTPEWAQRRIADKAPRSYTTQAADLQESDGEHLAATREVYLSLAQNHPQWNLIPVVPHNQPLSRDEVAENVWECLRQSKRLPMS